MARKQKSLLDVKKIKIGGFVYPLTWKNNLTTNEGEFVCGRITICDNLLEINSNQNPNYAWSVVLHEALHAIFYYGGHEQNEALIKYLGHAITTLLRDNPDFVACLNSVYELVDDPALEEPNLTPDAE